MITTTKTLIAENVEVDMETLRIARSSMEHPLARHRAQQTIVDSVVNTLDPEDRAQLEAYEGKKQDESH